MRTRRRSHVVVVHSSDEMYGADRMMLQVVDALRDVGADVEVWLPQDLPHGEFTLCEQLDSRGYTWRHVGLPVLRRSRLRPRRLPGLLRDWIRLCRLLRNARPGAVLLGSSACLLGASAARLVGVPSRILYVQERWTGTEARVLRFLARPTTLRIAISEDVAKAASLENPRAVVVANCVEDAATSVDRASLARDPKAPLVFLVASRWNRWKGHATLLSAWEHAGCPGRLVVLGGPPSTGDGVDVRELVARLVSRPDTVDVRGEVSDIASYIAAADVVVVPSDDPEPFGLVVIEAFSLGRPVVASDAGGPAEIIEDGRTGWLFDIRDSRHLAHVIGRLQPAEVAVAGRRARAAYEARYLPDRYRTVIGAQLGGELFGRSSSSDAEPPSR